MKTISRRARPHNITLYNYLSTAAGAMAFQRTVIKRVGLDTSYQQRLSMRGVSTTDTAQLIIDLRDIQTTGGRTFISIVGWKALTDAQKAQHFTFATDKDFFVQGEVPDMLPIVTKQQMQSKYQCLSITSAAIPASDHAEPVIVEVLAK